MIELEDHDHSSCVRQVLEAAEAVCKAQGLRLTDQRRAVLAILAESHIPASAYEILDQLNRQRKDTEENALAPVSVYRALDFLMTHRLIHRIESRNAYVACSGIHSEADDAHSDVTIFLLCDDCGRAGEFQSDALEGLIDSIAQTAQFKAHAPVLEIRGVCARCDAVQKD